MDPKKQNNSDSAAVTPRTSSSSSVVLYPDLFGVFQAQNSRPTNTETTKQVYNPNGCIR